MNWTPHIAAYIFGVSNLYAPTGDVQFTIVNWTPHIAAYIFGVSNLYAPTGSVQFTIVNWTPHIAAYIFGVSNLYAPIGDVQFTLVNWTPPMIDCSSLFPNTFFAQRKDASTFLDTQSDGIDDAEQEKTVEQYEEDEAPQVIGKQSREEIAQHGIDKSDHRRRKDDARKNLPDAKRGDLCSQPDTQGTGEHLHPDYRNEHPRGTACHSCHQITDGQDK